LEPSDFSLIAFFIEKMIIKLAKNITPIVKKLSEAISPKTDSDIERPKPPQIKKIIERIIDTIILPPLILTGLVLLSVAPPRTAALFR